MPTINDPKKFSNDVEQLLRLVSNHKEALEDEKPKNVTTAKFTAYRAIIAGDGKTGSLEKLSNCLREYQGTASYAMVLMGTGQSNDEKVAKANLSDFLQKNNSSLIEVFGKFMHDVATLEKRSAEYHQTGLFGKAKALTNSRSDLEKVCSDIKMGRESMDTLMKAITGGDYQVKQQMDASITTPQYESPKHR